MLALFIFFLFALAFGSMALTIWSTIDIARKSFKKDNDKALWLILVWMVAPIGGIVYLIKRKELYAEELDTREYLPDLESEWGRRETQIRYDEEDYV